MSDLEQNATTTDEAVEAYETADPHPIELGRRIKMLRVSRGLTLKDLEERGGISATHVSEIERGKASPTVGALSRIALALAVRPATLVEPRTLPLVSVTRAETRERRRIFWDKAYLSSVSGPTHGVSFGALLMRLPITTRPPTRGERVWHHHEGEEWLTVLSGQVEVHIDSDVHALRTGDALHFRSEIPHAYVNSASEQALLFVVCRPRLTI